MDYYIKAKELLDMDATEFVGGVSNSEIENAMEELSVILPESYKAFLADFGGGDAGGEIIFGITGNEEDDIVAATKMEREAGLPENLVIIGFWDDKLICLDTERMSYGECPVVELDEHYGERVLADTFGKFLHWYVSL